MTEVPKIVHERLRAARAQQPSHPNADVLTAFAEQALPQADRESVLEHLALCVDCREVAALALPALQESPAAPQRFEAATSETALPAYVESKRSWFAWPTLRWAALAAGIAVAVLLVRPALQNSRQPKAQNEPARQVVVVRDQAPAAAQSTVGSSPQTTSGAAEAQSHAEDVLHNSAAQPEAALRKKQLAFRGAMPSAKAPTEPLAGKLAYRSSLAAQAAAQNATAGMTLASSGAASPKTKARPTTVEANPVTEVAALSDSDQPVPSQSTPIERAKPPLGPAPSTPDKNTTVSASAMATSQGELPAAGRNYTTLTSNMPAAISAPAATWRINAGLLERSLDGSNIWQTSLRTDRAILCFQLRGQDIWAGGQSGTLMHSADNGATWIAVAVSYKNQILAGDITRIELVGATQILLSTAKQEIWGSLDAGHTWVKK